MRKKIPPTFISFSFKYIVCIRQIVTNRIKVEKSDRIKRAHLQNYVWQLEYIFVHETKKAQKLFYSENIPED